jgi:hypothetical protein
VVGISKVTYQGLSTKVLVFNFWNINLGLLWFGLLSYILGYGA